MRRRISQLRRSAVLCPVDTARLNPHRPINGAEPVAYEAGDSQAIVEPLAEEPHHPGGTPMLRNEKFDMFSFFPLFEVKMKL
jgi:hypothetical protein